MLKNTLEAMQEAVGGYIDIVGLDDKVCILLYDEGKLIGLEGNRRIGSDISYRKEVRRRSRFCEAKILTSCGLKVKKRGFFGGKTARFLPLKNDLWTDDIEEI